MSQAVDDLLAGAAGPPDDGTPHVRNGRYHLVHPTTGKPVTAQRASRFAKTIADTYAIEKADRRKVLYGAAIRPDITAAAIAAGPDDYGRLEGLAVAAKEAAGGSVAANLGTAMHDILEQADAGRPPVATPEIDADVAAYQATLDAHGIAVVPALMERFVYCEALGVAGRFDRILDHAGRLRMADIKTGAFLAWDSFAIQLAVYARAEWLWDPDTKAWVPMPALDAERGLVVHVPVGKGACEVYEIDIAAGWEIGCDLSAKVKGWRNRKGLATKLDATGSPGPGVVGVGEPVVQTSSAPELPGPTPPPGPAVDEARLPEWIDAAVANLRGRLRAVLDITGDTLPPGHAWPANVRTFRDGGPRSVEGVRLVETFVCGLESEFLDAWPDQVPPLPIVEPEFPETIEDVPVGAPPSPGLVAVELLAPWAVDEQRALVLACTGGQPVEPSRFTAAMLARLELVLAALDSGALSVEYPEVGAPQLVTPASTAFTLDQQHGTKTALVVAAKPLAVELGRPVPRSGAQVLADPVLVAALAAQAHPTKETIQP